MKNCSKRWFRTRKGSRFSKTVVRLRCLLDIDFGKELDGKEGADDHSEGKNS